MSGNCRRRQLWDLLLLGEEVTVACRCFIGCVTTIVSLLHFFS
jgi:hypothetical protein